MRSTAVFNNTLAPFRQISNVVAMVDMHALNPATEKNAPILHRWPFMHERGESTFVVVWTSRLHFPLWLHQLHHFMLVLPSCSLLNSLRGHRERLHRRTPIYSFCFEDVYPPLRSAQLTFSSSCSRFALAKPSDFRLSFFALNAAFSFWIKAYVSFFTLSSSASLS